MDHKSTIRHGAKEWHVDQHAELMVEIHAPEAGQPGCVMRIPDPEALGDPTDGITNLALYLIAAHWPTGLRVTPDAVWIGGEPLLQGPWRVGDQFSVIGAGIFVLLLGTDFFIGTMHFDVVSATPTTADLTCEFWVGRNRPMLSGRGELKLESDQQGLTRVHAYWERQHGKEWREATVTLTRTSIDGPGK